jgi:choline-sulfatase
LSTSTSKAPAALTRRVRTHSLRSSPQPLPLELAPLDFLRFPAVSEKPLARVLALAAVALAALVVAGHLRSGRPNLLLITVDTLRADRVGAYGWERAATSAIDGLARRGVLFEAAFTVAPVTLPAHATLLTGRLPPRHGVRGNSFYTLPHREVTLAEMLKEHGYRTGAVVAAAVLDRRFGLSRGFDLYDDEMPTNQGGLLIAERDAEVVVSRALAWLDHDAAGAPFFLWVHLFDPHHPYAPPGSPVPASRDAGYDGEIAHADRQIGRLVAALERRDALDETLIVLTSDHGESLGEHGEDTHGVFLYDATLRVPLIVVGPGVPTGVRRADAPVSLVDVVPTVLAKLSVVPRPRLDGEDLLAPRPSRREFVYSETHLPRDFYNWSELRALRSSDTKFVDAPMTELYDLKADPRESRNRAKDSPGAVTRLARLLDETVRERDGPEPIAPDPELARRLQSLGYVAGAPPRPAASELDGARPDPKTRIHLVKRLDQALAARAAHKEAAVVLLREILAEDPANYLAAHTLGEVCFELGRDTDAIAAYRVAMRGRDVAYYHYRLGLLHERQGNHVAAADEFGRLVRTAAEASTEIVERARGLLDRGAPAGALAYLDALEATGAERGLTVVRDDLRKTKADALNALGVARGEKGDLVRAVEAFSEAARLAPDHFEAQANLGFTELRRGSTERALAALGLALALRPGETRVINVMAEMRFRRNELEAARDLLVRSLSINPNQASITQALRDVERRLSAR